MENAANRIALTGALDTLPEYSHTNHDRNFYRLTLCVERLSSAFSDGWRSFVRGLQYFCIDLALMLPGLVLFLLIVFALFLLVRKIIRKTKARRDAKKEAPAPQAPTDSESKPE